MAISGRYVLLHSCNELNIHFRLRPPEINLINDVMVAISAMPGCLAYKAALNLDSLFQWTIRGVWACDQSKIAHYYSDEIQDLLHLLLVNNATQFVFSEPAWLPSDHCAFSKVLAQRYSSACQGVSK